MISPRWRGNIDAARVYLLYCLFGPLKGRTATWYLNVLTSAVTQSRYHGRARSLVQ
jgi:hypothetical protein